VVLALFIDPIVDRIDLSIKYDLVLAVIALCGLVVVCLPSDAGFTGSNLAEDNGF
jgi:drug/metabolite transporter superfamily protein YnfA